MSNSFGPDAAWITPSLAGQLQDQYQDVRWDWANKYTRTDIHDTALARIAKLEAGIEEKDERIEELESACEVVSNEFEGDLWVACRRLLTKTHFDFSTTSVDGVQAESFESHMNETLSEFDRAQARIVEIEKEVTDLKDVAIAFCGPWAATDAKRFGLPDGHIHPAHYDILEHCGARMNDFTRAALSTQENTDAG
jgi:hypothetical protein